MILLSIHLFPLRLRNFPAHFFCRFNPFFYHDLGIVQCILLCFSISHTSGKFRHFGYITIIIFTPVYNNFISYTSNLYFRIKFLICFTW